MTKAMEDLTQVPAIIASLGSAIAESQKQFDTNYLNGIQTFAAIAKAFSGAAPPPAPVPPAPGGPPPPGPGADAWDILTGLIKTAAPPRYQFTETTLTVRLDLAQSTEMAGQVGLGFGFAGVVINAAFSMSSSQNFRESAEIKTTIHAVLPQDNGTVFDKLIQRAAQLTAVPLPDKAEMDQKVFDAMGKAAAALGAKGDQNPVAKPNA